MFLCNCKWWWKWDWRYHLLFFHFTFFSPPGALRLVHLRLLTLIFHFSSYFAPIFLLICCCLCHREQTPRLIIACLVATTPVAVITAVFVNRGELCPLVPVNLTPTSTTTTFAAGINQWGCETFHLVGVYVCVRHSHCRLCLPVTLSATSSMCLLTPGHYWWFTLLPPNPLLSPFLQSPGP